MNTSSLRAVSLAGILTAAVLLTGTSAAKGQSASQIYTDAVQTYEAGDIPGAKQKLRLALEADHNFRARHSTPHQNLLRMRNRPVRSHWEFRRRPCQK